MRLRFAFSRRFGCCSHAVTDYLRRQLPHLPSLKRFGAGVLSTAAAETTRVRSAAGHGSWTIRTVSAGPTSCVGAVYLLTSDKIWRRRMSVCGCSRQHLFLHGPSKLMGPICKPGNGHVSAISPGRMVEIAPHGVFPWPDVHPRRHALSGQPPLRAQMSRARRAAGRYEIALRLRSSGCRCRAGLLARRA